MILKSDIDSSNVKSSEMVFQSRINGAVDFYKRWRDYEIGFGNLKFEFWLGNRFINLLTSSENYKLYVHLEDFEGNSKYAQYSRFGVGDAATNYILRVTGYCGTAGDSLMEYHNGMKFTTIDRDNDFFDGRNCGQMRLDGLEDMAQSVLFFQNYTNGDQKELKHTSPTRKVQNT